MSRVAFVNGHYVAFADAAVHVEDRGLQFADSIYEVCAIVDGRTLDEEGHWARLKRSLGELHQPMPFGIPALKSHLREMVRRNRIRNGLVYIQVTRGVARRDHPFPVNAVPQTVIMTARRVDFAKAQAMAAAGVAVITQPDIRWGRCDIKTTGLTANILAKQAAREAGAYEAWLVDSDGLVTEGSSSNAWIVDERGTLVTRPLSNHILPGITRQTVMKLAHDRQIKVEERAFSAADIARAREAFVTSAGGPVMPVVRVDRHAIGDGKPGPIATMLRQDYLALHGVA